ncbi:MAG: sugar ABC transporter permease [Chloroflexi bacterium]|nr:sugar ABC transporter permease [Chloroflexota bacterium]MCI0574938.1 sugar ABC transporter permease [Chloroflexota bacterium]MCI0645848.1 sugar ABC transporter permease [Chloroflexota bacterium]MCI0725703.1 sugar ABC transporter permease [Chloroflexota bacterium]
MKQRARLWDLRRRQERFALLLLLPSAVMIILFIAYPIVYSFFLTFSEFTVREQRWFAAGLGNYQKVWGDPAFRSALGFTLKFTAVYVPLSVGLALLVSVLLQQIRVGITFFRSLLFLPTVVPITMGFLMFQWVLDPANGIVNYLLRNALGAPELARNWFSDPQTVFSALIAVTLWGFGPWILILAGLLAIPTELYDAARVDGATHLQEFRHITLPQLRNTLMVVTTYQMIFALKIFVPIYVITGGGPAGQSKSLYYLAFEKINSNKLDYSTTVGWIFTLIVVILAIMTAVAFRGGKDDA